MPRQFAIPPREERLAFFQGFLRRPQQVGSVIPSSRFLKRRLVKAADIAHARLVVELGPGTGGTTRALLQALPRDARLLCIEIEPRFAALLRGLTDPRLIVHQGSAADLRRILARYRLGAPDAVVSGIPFSTMPPALGRQVVAAIQRELAPGGRFVAYQVRGKVAEIARPLFGRPEVAFELLNIPPARLFWWRAISPRV
jgi:phospholipid N-methyltransferase